MKKKSKINQQKFQNSELKLKINFNHYSKLTNIKKNNIDNPGMKKIGKLQEKKGNKDTKNTKYIIKPFYEKINKRERKNNKENKNKKDNKNKSDYQYNNKIRYDWKKESSDRDRDRNVNKSQDCINKNTKNRKNFFSYKTENFHKKYNTNITSASRDDIKEKSLNKNRENSESKQTICYHSSFMTRRRENKEKSDDLSDIEAIPQKFKNIYKFANNTNLKITINIKRNNLTSTISKTQEQTIEDIYNRCLMFEKNLLSKKKKCDKCHHLVDSHLYRIHYNSHCTEILDWLYLGTFANACDINELRRLKINYILNVAIECTNKKLPKYIKELHLNIPDYERFELYDYFEEANDFINKCKSERGHLLVHCKYAISRSVSFVIAYLIKYMRYKTDYALKFIQEKRKQIRPNQGFLEQLYKYEEYYLGKKR
jgi:dual specificity phosphatase 12